MDNQVLDEDFNSGKDSSFDLQTIKQINLLKIDINDHIKHIKNARITFIVLSCLLAFSTLLSVMYMNVGDSATEILIETAIIILIYIACAVGISSNPKVAIIIGFSVYILLILLNALFIPETIFQGIIIKVIVIMYLSRGVQGAFGLSKKLKKLFRLGVPVSDIEKAKRLKYVDHT